MGILISPLFSTPTLAYICFVSYSTHPDGRLDSHARLEATRPLQFRTAVQGSQSRQAFAFTDANTNPALALGNVIDGKRAIESRSSYGAPGPEGDCPIRFCEADTPIQTSCKHSYCLECFEERCESAASISTNGFQIKCQGDGSICSTEFNLSSSVFETVLKSSFEEYVQRHPETFRYCPTALGSNPPVQTVLRRSAPPATRDMVITRCAEYKDTASGGYEAQEVEEEN